MIRTFPRLLAAAAVAVVLLAGCGSDHSEEPSRTPAADVIDAEDYTGPPLSVESRSVDPEHTNKTCTKYTKVNGKRKCVTYKTETDDLDYLLHLSDGQTVDVDRATYDQYADGGVFPPTS